MHPHHRIRCDVFRLSLSEPRRDECVTAALTLNTAMSFTPDIRRRKYRAEATVRRVGLAQYQNQAISTPKCQGRMNI